MGNNTTRLRILSFAGVLILSSALLLGLFQEARGVSITIDDPSDDNITTSDSSVTFLVSVGIPQDERLPVQSVRAVVEETDNAGPAISAKVDPTVVADATCDSGDHLDSCPSGSANLVTDTGSALTAIEFVGGTPGNLAGYGYDLCTADPQGYCVVTHPGYEFTADRGYGYDRPELLGSSYTLDDATGGYGYNDGELTLQWRVTIDPGELSSGNFWLTFLVNTGSDVISELQGDAKYFEVTRSGGGGQSGGSGGASGAINVRLGQTFTGEAGDLLRITFGLPDGFNLIELELAIDCTRCSIVLNNHGSSPPAGTPAASENGFRAWQYFGLQLLDENGDEIEGGIAGGTLEWEASQADIGDGGPAAVGLLHFLDAKWDFEDTEIIGDEDDDPVEYRSTIPSFSEFANGADVAGPTITDEEPTGTIEAVTPQIAADWSDNREVDTSTFELTVDGTTVTSSMGQLTVSETGFSYIPAQALDEGDHTVQATVSDASGVETSKTWSFIVEVPECAEPPAITNVEPADGATNVPVDREIRVTVQQGSCLIASQSITMDGTSLDVNFDDVDGLLTATLPDTVEAGDMVTLTATVEDTGGNQQSRSWSYTTTQAEGDDPDGDGLGALAWVIIILIVLAVIGVGAYFYMEQQGGGAS